MSYKKDQGRYARLISYWVVLLVLVAGFWSMTGWLDGQFEIMKYKVIPAFGISVSILICLVLSILSALGVYWLLNREKTADLLIETESELKKCSWPTSQETWNNSIVVLVTVIFFMLFLAGADIMLKKLFDLVIF